MSLTFGITKSNDNESLWSVLVAIAKLQRKREEKLFFLVLPLAIFMAHLSSFVQFFLFNFCFRSKYDRPCG
jgi:hypothetical protein